MSIPPRKAAVYVRISRAPAGDVHGIANQASDIERWLTTHSDYIVVQRQTDNDLSATQGKHRPGYAKLMEAAGRGEFEAIIVWQSSRLWRNRKERAEGIELLRKAAVSVVATKGPSLDMSTAYGRAMAGLLGEFDTLEVEVKAERQVLAALERSENGKPPLGVRLIGYTTKGEVIESEAVIVRQMFDRFHAGDSLRGLVAWLNETCPSRHGRPWLPSTVRRILVNPRYAGRAIYNGTANGKRGQWTPLVSEALFDAVGTRLADPRRRKHVGTDRKHLGSGLYLCGVCDAPVRCHSGDEKRVRYRPPCGHVTRTAGPIDELVLGEVRKRLGLPDLGDLLVAPRDEKASEAETQIKGFRARIEQTEADYDGDLIDARRYKVKAAKLQAQLDAVLAAQARMMGDGAVAGMLAGPDPVAAFDAAPLGVKRAVVAFFVTVRLYPAPRGRHFDPASDSVDIQPREN